MPDASRELFPERKEEDSATEYVTWAIMLYSNLPELVIKVTLMSYHRRCRGSLNERIQLNSFIYITYIIPTDAFLYLRLLYWLTLTGQSNTTLDDKVLTASHSLYLSNTVAPYYYKRGKLFHWNNISKLPFFTIFFQLVIVRICAFLYLFWLLISVEALSAESIEVSIL